MKRVKSKFVCTECGYEAAGYLGKCPECNSWGTLVEEVISDTLNNKKLSTINNEKPLLINDIPISESVRVSTNISEFDRVLGGGLVQGSLVLLAGSPGIGKSTLILQTSGQLCNKNLKVLYVSAEESATQVKLRAERLKINTDLLYIYPQTNIDSLDEQINNIKPDIVVVDSIQAVYTNNLTSSAGSVGQVRECCNYLMR